MKRLLIVCEGQTEQEFCNCILSPHLLYKGITVSAPLVKKSNGGIVSWASLRPQILNHLREGDVFVSMLVDYYGIKDNYGFPGWESSKSIPDKTERIHFLIEKMRDDVAEEYRYRFLPYIQLHEFEGLLFSDGNAFRYVFDPSEADYVQLDSIIAEFPNPEEINNSSKTAPSKRLIKAIPGYNKVVYGNMIAEQIGLQTIRDKCPLFNEWLTHLEQI